MAKRVRKNRSVRMLDKEWAVVERAAALESRRRDEPIEAGTLARELVLRGARRITSRAESSIARPADSLAA